MIVGRKRVSAYDLWQYPCYRLWQKKNCPQQGVMSQARIQHHEEVRYYLTLSHTVPVSISMTTPDMVYDILNQHMGYPLG